MLCINPVQKACFFAVVNQLLIYTHLPIRGCICKKVQSPCVRIKQQFITIVSTDDGVRVTHSSSSVAQDYMHAVNKAVAVDGAHMKLTVHNPGGTRFYVILSNDAGNSKAEGISFMMYPAGGQFAIGRNAFSAIDHTGYKECNGVNTDRVFLPATV